MSLFIPGPYGNWFFELEGYAGSVMNAVIADGNFNVKYGREGQIVNLSTRNALEFEELHPNRRFKVEENVGGLLKEADDLYKGKWDALLP
jgi:hypothetical protein